MNVVSEFTHKDLPVYSFKTETDFLNWLSKNHDISTGFWLHFYKKATNIPSVDYPEAVDVALCYGWIDGLLNPHDDKSYLVRFTTRRPKSVWSKVNVAKAEKLIAEKRMQLSGLAQVESAKLDGRWAAAYSSKRPS
ncbi:MAG: hypothetical protein WCP56_03175 [Candidatus Saccharibacteria bacterium]